MNRWIYAVFLVGLPACVGATRSVPAPAAPKSDLALPERSAPVAVQPRTATHDSPERAVSPEPSQPPQPHPLEQFSDEQLEQLLTDDPGTLGALSLGTPNAGALFGGQEMQSSDRWEVVNPAETWGTPETIEFLTRSIDKVHAQFPDTRILPIGDISKPSGGHLAPHVSHQSGRDVDLGYYYSQPLRWYTTANASNLDLPRTWALVRAMVTDTDVEAIFIDNRIQRLLRDYAVSIGESPQWVDTIFGGPLGKGRPIVSHEPGHASHIHVRFYNPVSQESGRRLYGIMLARKMLKPPTYYTRYKARRGDTLLRIARKNRTSVKALKKANRLRSNSIFAGRTYKIPRRGGVVPSKRARAIPMRRLPPPEVVPLSPAEQLARITGSTDAPEGGSEVAADAPVTETAPAIETAPPAEAAPTTETAPAAETASPTETVSAQHDGGKPQVPEAPKNDGAVTESEAAPADTAPSGDKPVLEGPAAEGTVGAPAATQ